MAIRKGTETAGRSTSSDEVCVGGQLETAVLLLAFNRPDTTARVFDAIRRARPTRLYVALDGPRNERGGEVEKVEAVRRIVTAADWPCEVKTLFREGNLGCKTAVSNAIDWVFRFEEQAIILEDDCLPSPSFFGFCEELLARYSDDHRVMHIGGYKPTDVGRDRYAYNFSRYTHVWGWATWKRAWQYYDVDMKVLAEAGERILEEYEFFCSGVSNERRKKVLRDVAENRLDTWDYQWNFAVRINSGLAVRPCVNLVENLGEGHPDATHTLRHAKVQSAGELRLPITEHPPFCMINRALDKAHERRAGRGLLRRAIERCCRWA